MAQTILDRDGPTPCGRSRWHAWHAGWKSCCGYVEFSSPWASHTDKSFRSTIITFFLKSTNFLITFYRSNWWYFLAFMQFLLAERNTFASSSKWIALGPQRTRTNKTDLKMLARVVYISLINSSCLYHSDFFYEVFNEEIHFIRNSSW